MKLSIRKPRTSNNEDNLIPMINVVFLMLIFFMLAGQITASDAFKVSPPTSDSDTLQEKAAIELTLGQADQLAINGKEIALSDLRLELARAIKSDLGAAPITVALKADARMSALQLRSILAEITRISPNSITLYTQRAAL